MEYVSNPHPPPAHVAVRTPSGNFTWFRGPGHTADDVAAIAARRFWPHMDPRDLVVVNHTGSCMRYFASRLHAATVLYVNLPMGSGG